MNICLTFVQSNSIITMSCLESIQCGPELVTEVVGSDTSTWLAIKDDCQSSLRLSHWRASCQTTSDCRFNKLHSVSVHWPTKILYHRRADDSALNNILYVLSGNISWANNQTTNKRKDVICSSTKLSKYCLMKIRVQTDCSKTHCCCNETAHTHTEQFCVFLRYHCKNYVSLRCNFHFVVLGN